MDSKISFGKYYEVWKFQATERLQIVKKFLI